MLRASKGFQQMGRRQVCAAPFRHLRKTLGPALLSSCRRLPVKPALRGRSLQCLQRLGLGEGARSCGPTRATALHCARVGCASLPGAWRAGPLRVPPSPWLWATWGQPWHGLMGLPRSSSTGTQAPETTPSSLETTPNLEASRGNKSNTANSHSPPPRIKCPARVSADLGISGLHAPLSPGAVGASLQARALHGPQLHGQDVWDVEKALSTIRTLVQPADLTGPLQSGPEQDPAQQQATAGCTPL